MSTISKLEEKVAVLRKQLASPDDKANLEEEIDSIQDDIDEIESHNREMEEQDEEMGNTAQDRYFEENHYAIVQSERYEQFRKEY